jgi:hypothetical protein
MTTTPSQDAGRIFLWPFTDDPYVRWTPVVRRQQQPNADMQQLIDATQAAVDDGLKYADEVYASVVARMAARLTPELLARGATRVERGNFGMEIYYARKYLDALQLEQRLADAFEQLAAQPGMHLGPLIFLDQKQTSACYVVRVDDHSGLITVRGKRGRHEVQVESTALQILAAVRSYRDRLGRRTGREEHSCSVTRFA